MSESDEQYGDYYDNEEEEEEEEEDNSDDEDEDDEDEDDEEESKQQQAMKNIPLGERLRLHQESEPATIFRKRKEQKKKNMLEREGKQEDEGAVRSRPNKNYPAVVSSKKKVGRWREIGQPAREKSRDPRFDDLSGRLNYDRFYQSYGFLEEQQERDVAKLKKQKKRAHGAKQEAVAATLAQTQQQMAERKRAIRVREKVRQKKKEEQEAVAQGKNPYFLKQSAVKQIALEDRYSELKQQGKLEKFLQKKRKRNAAKDHRWLPSRRVRTEEP